MYEKTINRWIEELETWIDGFVQEIDPATKASDPYPPEQSYIKQCDKDIKACLYAIYELQKLRNTLAEPNHPVEDDHV